MSRARLTVRMLLKGISGFALIGALLFVPAGSFAYTEAWRFMLFMALMMLTFGIALLLNDPDTLNRRLNSKETQPKQRAYIALFGLMFVLSFVLAGFDYRCKWSHMPNWVSIAALALMGVGYLLYGMVIRQNAYAARVVQVEEGQRVITTGVYAIVRHPMYLACLLLFLMMPLALGSYVALLPMVALPILLALRIKNEEAVLMDELAGYKEYMQKTKYRLIPFVW